MFNFLKQMSKETFSKPIEEIIADIANNSITEDDVYNLFDYFRDLNPTQLKTLSEAFKTNTNFQILDLTRWAGDHLNGEIFKFFLDAIEENPNSGISVIIFGRDAAKDENLQAFSDFLKKTSYKKLISFDASGGGFEGISDTGAIALGEALSQTSVALSSFNLTFNSIGDPGIKKIAEGLTSNPINNHINNAFLDKNPKITDESIESLKTVIEYRQKNPDSKSIKFGVGENVDKTSRNKVIELEQLEKKLASMKTQPQEKSGNALNL